MPENRELALVLKLIADQFQSEMKKSGGIAQDFQRVVADWRVQLTAVSGALFAVAKSTADYGDELVTTSQRMGTTIADTARLRYAAQLSDLDLQSLSASVGYLSKQMIEADLGLGEAKRNLDLLQLSTRDQNGQFKSTIELLLELNDKFRLMPEGPEKTAKAMLALVRSGKEALPLLNSNLREAFQEADRLGLVMDDKAAKAAEHFNDELTKLKSAVRGVTNDVGNLLIPKFDALAHALTTVIEDAHNLAKALLAIPEQPNIGVVKPEGGGRNLRILPPPPGIEKAQVEPFFATKEQDVKKLQADYQLYITGLTAMGQEFLDKQKTGYQLYIQGLTLLGQEYLASVRGTGDEMVQLFRQHQAEIDEAFDKEAARERENRQAREETFAAQKRLDEAAFKQRKAREQLEIDLDRARQDQAKRERDSLAENLTAWRDYAEQVGASNELMLEKELDLVRANLAQKLALDQETAGRLLIAWQNHDYELANEILSRTDLTEQQRETLMLRTLANYDRAVKQYSDDFLEGWAEGMRRYVKDTQSGFGLAADMARRAFQTVEQSAGRFFFDAMEGRITRLKDVMASFLSFAKQVASQLAGQYITRTLAGALFGGGGGGGSGAVDLDFNVGAVTGNKGYAEGGSFRIPGAGGGDSVAVGFWARPGENVTVDPPGAGAGVTVIVNNYGQNDVQTSSRQGPDGGQLIYVTVRDMVQGMIQGGDMDAPFGRRFGLTPAPGRR